MKTWLRPLPVALLLAYAASRLARTTPVDDAAPNRSAALATALATTGVTCTADDIVWLDGPSGVFGAMFGSARALVRGRDREDIVDLFLVRARLSPEGQVLDVDEPHNVTRSSSADEGRPVVRGTFAAYVVEAYGRPEAVHVLDLSGHDATAYEELTPMQRAQVKIASLQQTGQARGVKRTVYALMPPPKQAAVAFKEDGSLEIRADDRSLVVDPARSELRSGSADALRISAEDVIAKPPTFAPWMSDRLRAVSWIGDEKNQALKAVLFTAMEWAKGRRAALTGDTGEKDAQEDLAALNAGKGEPATFTDPEIGWPPKALDPMIKPALAGEGQWITLDKDPFITPIPGVATPFVTTFVRSDPAAQHTRVYVTLWDPRLIALHMEAGTVEPVSATGEAGPGQIPRSPEVMRHVVAGFNGGFQATHGEFGMQANGVLYLPPKPYAATVAELRDGTTAFGAWPKNEGVPEDVLSFRQNMSPIVQNGKYNPWGRAWWGGVPPGWHDAVHTTRSGICLTKENFVAYFFGHDIGPEPLGRAMLVARCQIGMHLDMNPGLAGFEFYDMQPAATFQPLGRPLQADWEYEGTLKDMPELKYRARRMIKSMGHIQFPRYIQRDGRDFFYLTSRTVLPGAPIANGTTWRVKGLPQHGYPYALAITATEHDGVRMRVLRLDARTLRGEAPAGTDATAPLVVSIGRPPKPGVKGRPDAGAPREYAEGKSLWLAGDLNLFIIAKTAPAGSTALAEVVSPQDARDPRGGQASHEARAAVGISDEDGLLQWIELPPDVPSSPAATSAMLGLLEKLGCSARGLVRGDLRAFPGGSLDTAGETTAPPLPGAVRLFREPAPGAKQFFESTEIVPQSVWGPLQAQRVKWRPTLAPPDKPAASSSASAAAGSAAPPATSATPPGQAKPNGR